MFAELPWVWWAPYQTFTHWKYGVDTGPSGPRVRHGDMPSASMPVHFDTWRLYVVQLTHDHVHTKHTSSWQLCSTIYTQTALGMVLVRQSSPINVIDSRECCCSQVWWIADLTRFIQGWVLKIRDRCRLIGCQEALSTCALYERRHKYYVVL